MWLLLKLEEIAYYLCETHTNQRLVFFIQTVLQTFFCEYPVAQVLVKHAHSAFPIKEQSIIHYVVATFISVCTPISTSGSITLENNHCKHEKVRQLKPCNYILSYNIAVISTYSRPYLLFQHRHRNWKFQPLSNDRIMSCPLQNAGTSWISSQS